jgi:cardiolipin synthase C
MDFKLNLISFIFTSAIGVVSLNTNAQFDDYPFYAESIVQNTTPSESKIVENQVQILHSGIASFQKRIDLVRKAKKSIIMEYFIWEKDTSGLLLIH